jgi:hypothetical protein
MKRELIYIFFSLIISHVLLAQNEANVWYFNYTCGLEFDSDIPMVLGDGQSVYGATTSTISDSLGNLLFYSDWGYIYTDYGILQNGTGIQDPGVSGFAVVKWPGRNDIYYLFTAVSPLEADHGLNYSLIDFTANNGLGSVIEKNVKISAGWDVSDRIATVRKENSSAIWVIVRKNEEDAFASFIVDDNGLDPNPIISAMPEGVPDWQGRWGYVKISHNKKYLISSYTNRIEICHLNVFDGTVDFMYNLTAPQNEPNTKIVGIEFSPDSKFLYVCLDREDHNNALYQYDMQYILDYLLFFNSAQLVATGNAFCLQLARDGKIYCTPNVEFVENSVFQIFMESLIDYLLRFEWTGETCQGYPIQFKPNFIPTPQTIQWDFDDGPGSTSWQLSPTYTFKIPVFMK